MNGQAGLHSREHGQLTAMKNQHATCHVRCHAHVTADDASAGVGGAASRAMARGVVGALLLLGLLAPIPVG